MTEFLPSGVLKVAPLQGLSSWLNHMAYKFPEDGPTLSAWAKEVAALASPPPQATGALSEPVGEIVGTEKRGFALMTVVRWEPGFNRTKVGTLLYTAASQVEPEDKQ